MLVDPAPTGAKTLQNAQDGKPPLKPMVPPFRPGEISKAWELIGQKEQHIYQLQVEMMERAEIANKLDDDNIRLKEVNEKLGQELHESRSHAAELELELRQLKGEASSRRRKKRKE